MTKRAAEYAAYARPRVDDAPVVYYQAPAAVQAPSSYNLAQVMAEIEAQKRALKGGHPSD